MGHNLGATGPSTFPPHTRRHHRYTKGKIEAITESPVSSGKFRKQTEVSGPSMLPLDVQLIITCLRTQAKPIHTSKSKTSTPAKRDMVSIIHLVSSSLPPFTDHAQLIFCCCSPVLLRRWNLRTYKRGRGQHRQERQGQDFILFQQHQTSKEIQSSKACLKEEVKLARYSNERAMKLPQTSMIDPHHLAANPLANV